MVGDSTLAGVRNVTASQALFVGFDPVLDAQGCRRLVWPSCWSDSDFRVPNTVEEAILTTPGTLDVVVVMSGYNDWNDPFGSFVDTIMAAAHREGSPTGRLVDTQHGHATGVKRDGDRGVRREHDIAVGVGARHRDLVVADWRTYNQRSIGWMKEDGVHLEHAVRSGWPTTCRAGSLTSMGGRVPHRSTPAVLDRTRAPTRTR